MTILLTTVLIYLLISGGLSYWLTYKSYKKYKLEPSLPVKIWDIVQYFVLIPFFIILVVVFGIFLTIVLLIVNLPIPKKWKFFINNKLLKFYTYLNSKKS